MGRSRSKPGNEGGEAAKPDHSLPSYSEPTPEASRAMSREDEAELALKNTVFSPRARLVLILGFLITVSAVPIIQLRAEIHANSHGNTLPMFDVFKALPGWKKICAVRSFPDVWSLLPTAHELKSAEKRLEDQSVVSQSILPGAQTILTGVLGAGNEQAYVGRDGWLFYRPDVDYVTGPSFLDSERLKKRALKSEIKPHPIPAILDFRNQLAARGIDLVVMPVPVKPSIDGEMLSLRKPQEGALQNAGFDEFKDRLEKEGVRIFDPTPALIDRKRVNGGNPLYLQTDTHWRPETMEFIVRKLVEFLHAPPPAQRATLRILDQEIAGLGDIATMLRLPKSQRIFPTQRVTVHQVTVDAGLWHPEKDADVLFLGDSFSNIFSLEAMGWGESAGFAEHLSRALERRGIDCIVRNSDGAFSTREILSQALARGHDRLAGKKLVIWEFAARELAIGNWKLIPLMVGQPQASHSFSVNPGEQVLVTGTVEEASPIPRPGAVPYKDHIFSLHLVDIDSPIQSEKTGSHAVVYLWSMRDNVWTTAARLRPGTRIHIRLRAWDEVSAKYEKFNRSEIEDGELQKEEPLWGELAPY